MKKIPGIIFSVCLALIAFWGFSVQSDTKMLIDSFSSELSKSDSKRALKVIKKNREIVPRYWPFSIVHSFLDDGDAIEEKIYEIKSIEEPLNNLGVVTEKGFELLSASLKPLQKIERVFFFFPEIFLSEEHAEKLDFIKAQVRTSKELLLALKDFQITVETLYKNESRVMVILQNQNEPRPTGGFMGSLVFLDFKKDKTIDWGFRDIYSLDRKVDSSLEVPAPEWFHGLSNVISLRDANFWSDFPTSAKKILGFLDSTDEKVPDIVLAINMNVIKEVLRLTGPVELDKWGVVLNEYNFDVVLQFLVEGKVLGRYNVKDPVVLAANKIFSPENLGKISADDLQAFDWKAFLQQKNIQGYSSNSRFQRLFDQWKISGRSIIKSDTDDFLQLDFISVGANKSEKFMWTKISHDSLIAQDGKVLNTLKIIRNHSLQTGEIFDLLSTNTWSENLKDLITDDLLWKIGAGQNRTYIRVHVPKGSKLVSQISPSGEVTIVSNGRIPSSRDKGNFTNNAESLNSSSFFEIPAFVSPGERLEIVLTYETNIEKGSHNWRPYNFQLIGTAGKAKTEFLKTISTKNPGKFSAETYNIGRPVNLVDQDFKAVLEF